MATVREALKKSRALVGVVRALRKIPSAARHNARVPRIVKRLARPARIRTYLRANGTRKLQLGAGPTLLPGWLCTDLVPASDEVLYLDVTRRFPFDDGAFDYIFDEHLIEHLSWANGQAMLRECHRVLKPGGIIRTATPDLAIILSLYAPAGSHAREKYIRWITDTFLPGVDVYKPQFVINNAFRNWGHQFLYDGDMLELALSRAGFVDITRCKYGGSVHDPLRGIECHGVNVDVAEMATFETMIFEAKRPV